MRITHDSDLYVLLRNAGRDVEVFCDGIKQGDVLSADEERGEVVRHRDTPTKTLHGHRTTETIKGRVQIEIVRRQP